MFKNYDNLEPKPSLFALKMMIIVQTRPQNNVPYLKGWKKMGISHILSINTYIYEDTCIHFPFAFQVILINSGSLAPPEEAELWKNHLHQFSGRIVR